MNKRFFNICAVLCVLASFVMAAGCFDKKNNDAPKAEPEKKSEEVQYYTNMTVGYRIPMSKSWEVRECPGADIMMICKTGTFTPEPVMNVITVKTKEYDVWDKKAQKAIKDQINPNMVPASEENITVSGKHAYRLVYGLENESVSIIINQTAFFHNGFQFIITCRARETEYDRFSKIFADYIDEFIFMEPAAASGDGNSKDTDGKKEK